MWLLGLDGIMRVAEVVGRFASQKDRGWRKIQEHWGWLSRMSKVEILLEFELQDWSVSTVESRDFALHTHQQLSTH